VGRHRRRARCAATRIPARDTLGPPRWPDPEHPQQLHLDIRVDDVDAAERAVLALGARRLPTERESGFRVFADPVGHPFCLVFG
jgi:hypothetical protein